MLFGQKSYFVSSAKMEVIIFRKCYENEQLCLWVSAFFFYSTLRIGRFQISFSVTIIQRVIRSIFLAKTKQGPFYQKDLNPLLGFLFGRWVWGSCTPPPSGKHNFHTCYEVDNQKMETNILPMRICKTYVQGLGFVNKIN